MNESVDGLSSIEPAARTARERAGFHWIVHVRTPRLAAAAALVAVSLSPPLGASSADPNPVALPPALASFLTDEAHGSASDRDSLLAGEPVVRLLDADPAREVAVLGAVWVNAPSTLYVQQVKRIEELERGRALHHQTD